MIQVIRHIVILSTLLLISFPVFAQSYKFRLYTYKEGLAQDYVYALTQSKRGNLWIATGEGLCRFDGKNFITFSEKQNWDNNFSTAVFSDSKNNIWIGNFNGSISLYNGDRFTHLKLDKLSKSPINLFFEDSKGNIWAGTRNNGLLLIKKDLTVEVFNEQFDSSINAMAEDSSHTLYIGTNNGILSLKLIDEKLTNTNYILPNHQIESLCFASTLQKLLIGTFEQGLLQLTPGDTVLQTMIPFTEDEINIIQKDQRTGDLWISSYGKGIYKCRLNNNNLEIRQHFSEKSGLPGNYVKCLFTDRENNTWFGTFGSGLTMLLEPNFTLYTHLDGLSDNNIKSIFEDKHNNLWLASENKLSIYLRKERQFKPVRAKDLPNQITSITGLDSLILLGTQENGIYIYNPYTLYTKPWFTSHHNKLYNQINHLQTDKAGNIWIASNGGLIHYIKPDNRFDIFTTQDGLPHNKIKGIYIDEGDTVWLATSGSGLSAYSGGKFLFFPSPIHDRGLDINCFVKDKEGRLWIGTYGEGIFLFENGKFVKHYSKKDQLNSPYCYFLALDSKNNLWIGHKTGISKFDISKEEFSFFENTDETVIGESNYLACQPDPDGGFWFGTIHGLVKFNPESKRNKSLGPIVNLTGVLLDFHEVNWKNFSDSVFYFGRIPADLTLPYNKNHLTFKVAGVTLKNQNNKIRYQYLLEGFDKDWSLITNEPFVTYSNLPPGNYTLKVKAGITNGEWSKMTNNFRFTIRSPFWQTWWFLSAIFFGTVWSMYGIVKVRTQRLRQQREKLRKDKMILEAEIKERIKAQNEQKRVEEKLKQTNQELNNFIYRSSHDLRGPISTVKGLTQLGAMEVEDPDAKKFFSLILNRTQILDSVLKNLINIVEVIEGEILISEINFNVLVGEVLNDLQKEKEYDITKVQRIIEPDLTFYSDKKLFSLIIKNLLDNSLKYNDKSKENEEVKIEISSLNEGVVIRCIDNGIGISEEIKPKIFDMFYRGTDESKGSGLGLYTIKKIVEKLNGSITLDSQTGAGTRVDIFIPRTQLPNKG